jgi:hypothetical protein
MELPGTNDSSGNDTTASNSNEEQIKESFENAAATTETIAVGSVKTETTEVAAMESGKDSLTTGVTSMFGKRDHDSQNSTVAATTTTSTSSTGMGIMGANNAKRGKHEWLSFRGTRQTRVGENYQVTSLPPVDNTNIDNTPTNGKGK